MARNVIVRFAEMQNYDINIDAEVVRFMAMTSSGSFWSDVLAEGAGSLRRARNEFRETVVELIQAGQPPCEIQLDQEDQ